MGRFLDTEYLTVQEVAQRLRVSEHRLYALIDEGKILAHKPVGLKGYRIPETAVLDWLEGREAVVVSLGERRTG